MSALKREPAAGKSTNMPVKLGINTGFALNRFTSPEEWIPIVGDLGLKTVQFTADLLNPSLPDGIIQAQIKKIRDMTGDRGIRITSTFTSAFTRVNHLAHPDPDFRKYWLDWFYRFVDISAALGAECMGSHFGILTVRDNSDEHVRKERFEQNVNGWKKIARYAQTKGLKYLLWEPMSIPRELGETLEEARRIHDIVNEDIAIPMKMCLDVDHGDVSSPNPEDTDPYAWIRDFAKESPFIHIKQTLLDKGGHWAFTPENNKKGKIQGEEFIRALEKAGVKDTVLLLELSFREREPFESRVVEDIRGSVEYWRSFVKE